MAGGALSLERQDCVVGDEAHRDGGAGGGRAAAECQAFPSARSYDSRIGLPSGFGCVYGVGCAGIGVCQRWQRKF